MEIPVFYNVGDRAYIDLGCHVLSQMTQCWAMAVSARQRNDFAATVPGHTQGWHHWPNSRNGQRITRTVTICLLTSEPMMSALKRMTHV